MSDLPGVKVGPLDPEATAEFGQVARQNSARQLIRLHSQMYPMQLRRALTRPMDEPHTKAASENLDVVSEFARGLTRENGDPVLPEGSEIVGAAVRGERATGQVLTFQFRLPSGRIGKWFARYSPETLPEIHELGREYARVREMRDRGMVEFDREATGQEILRRQLGSARAESQRLRTALEGRSGESAGDVPQSESDVRPSQQITAEMDAMRQELAELRAFKAQRDALSDASGGGLPVGGIEADIAASAGGPGPAGAREPAASQDPPFEGYDDLKADEVATRIRSGDSSVEDVRAILSYEQAHANRRTVVSTAEQHLDRQSGE